MLSALQMNLFSFLLNKKKSLRPLRPQEEIMFEFIAKKYLLSGFMLQSLAFHEANKNLADNLRELSRNYLISYMIKKKQLRNLSFAFTKENIKFVVLKGMALNLEQIFQPYVRQSRDIDLLVKKDDVKVAYKIARSLGYKYLSPNTQDNANHLYGHQLPPLTNDFMSILELHWRVTGKYNFENCPITNTMFEQRKECSQWKGIFIPNIEGMMAHTLYHGFVHHRLNHGPLFLFDLAAIYRYNQNKWPKNISLIKKLGLTDTFNKCVRIIEKTEKQNSFSSESKKLISNLFKNFDWEEGGKKAQISVFNATRQKTSALNVVSNLRNKIQDISQLYQAAPSTPKYWFLFLKHFFKKFKT